MNSVERGTKMKSKGWNFELNWQDEMKSKMRWNLKVGTLNWTDKITLNIWAAVNRRQNWSGIQSSHSHSNSRYFSELSFYKRFVRPWFFMALGLIGARSHKRIVSQKLVSLESGPPFGFEIMSKAKFYPLSPLSVSKIGYGELVRLWLRSTEI